MATDFTEIANDMQTLSIGIFTVWKCFFQYNINYFIDIGYHSTNIVLILHELDEEICAPSILIG